MADPNITGGRELDAFLQQFSAKFEKNVMRGGLRAGANEFKEEVKANIPVDSGALRRSVRVTTNAKGGRVTASVKIGNKKAWYAQMVEFGTRA
ncbi:HK97-gp10 family putative phage morphogenesis protein, partial [Massilia pseudoviolaceinigra]